VPHLYRVIQPVTDVDAAAAFYGRVLGDPGRRVSPGRHYFDCGGTILACYDAVADGDDASDGWRPHFNQYLYFAVGDLDAALTAVIAAHGTIDAGIDTMPWGERLFYARDPWGNPIAFVDETTLFRGQARQPRDGFGNRPSP
jgi:predicted enzyme related to lactoylglutathione lyase